MNRVTPDAVLASWRRRWYTCILNILNTYKTLVDSKNWLPLNLYVLTSITKRKQNGIE